jgi:hypothetical protein
MTSVAAQPPATGVRSTGTMRRLLAPLVAVLALAPAAHAATWSAPQTVSAPHTFAGPLQLATSFNGLLIAVWPWQDNVGNDARGGESQAFRQPTVGFGPGQATASTFGPQRAALDGLVAIGPYSNQTLSLAARGLPRRSGPTGALLYAVDVVFGSLSTSSRSALRTLATAPVVGAPRLATGTRTALVTWIEVTRTSTGAIRRVVRAVDRRNGAWSKPYILSGRGRADTLATAMNERGDEVVAFARDGDVLVRVRRHGHSWGAIRRLARADGGTQWQLVAGVNERGQVRVVWRRHQLTREGVPGRTALESAALLVGRSTFTAAQMLTADGASIPRLAQTPQGWAVADVETTAAGPRPALHRTLGGSAFAPVAYAAQSDPTQPGARAADVAFSPVGGLTVAWVQPLAGQDSDGVARAASLDPGLPNPAFGPVEDVSPAEAVHEVRLGADTRAGQPVAVWTARPGGTGPSVPTGQIRTVVRSAIRLP